MQLLQAVWLFTGVWTLSAFPERHAILRFTEAKLAQELLHGRTNPDVPAREGVAVGQAHGAQAHPQIKRPEIQFIPEDGTAGFGLF